MNATSTCYYAMLSNSLYHNWQR